MSKQEHSKFSYDFTEEQVKTLAILFRNSENKLPSQLTEFYFALQDYLYSQMTIDEAECFFNEN